MLNQSQLKTILWLRWRLTMNQWRRGAGIGAVLSLLLAVAAIGLAGAAFLGGLAAGALALKTVSAEVIMWVWFGLTLFFLFVWTIGVLAELQRSEPVDLQRLMHLPVALGQMFVINYLASHMAISLFLCVPAMLGLMLGLAVGRGLQWLLLAPLALGVVFMITAWTYCFRGWLAAMMSNPRRRRAIIMAITLSIVLIGQAPNLYFNVIRKYSSDVPGKKATAEERQRGREQREAMLRSDVDKLVVAQAFIPPLWLPLAAREMAESNPRPALLCAAGCFVLGALGLRRAYSSTIRFYYGQTSARQAGRAAAAPPHDKPLPISPANGRPRTLLVERRPPFVPEQAAAIALATLRSMARAPEVKMAWATSFIVTLILGATLFGRAAPKVPAPAKPILVVGICAFSLFVLVQFMVNQFGFDRDAFRVLILSPVDRRLILLGKSLACLSVAALSSGLLTVCALFVFRLDFLDALSSILQLSAVLLLLGIWGNLISILFPYRVHAGTMKPTKLPALAMIALIACQLAFPLLIVPALLPPAAQWLLRELGLPEAVPVNLILSIALAGGAVALYRLTLGPLGRLLQRRETVILSKVTVETE